MTSTADRDVVVIGVDGSPSSIEALHWGTRIAQMTGATIDAVIAWEIPTMYGLAYLPSDYQPEQDAGKVIAEAIDTAYGPDRPDGLRLVVTQGNPAKVLLDASRDAQMLIVGSRGHGGFVGLLLGSVSSSCAEHAGCPVLVVHGHHDADATTS